MLQIEPHVRPCYGTVLMKGTRRKEPIIKCLALAWGDYDLWDYIKKLNPGCDDVRKKLGYQAVAGLQALHRHNITHKDMAARQFLVSWKEVALLLLLNF